MYLNIEIYTIPISLAHGWPCVRVSRLVKHHREASCCSLSVFLDMDTTALLSSALATSVSLTTSLAQWPLAVLQQKSPLGPKKHFPIDHHYTYMERKIEQSGLLIAFHVCFLCPAVNKKPTLGPVLCNQILRQNKTNALAAKSMFNESCRIQKERDFYVWNMFGNL